LEVGVRKNEKELQLLKTRTEDAENWVKLRASEVETVRAQVSVVLNI